MIRKQEQLLSQEGATKKSTTTTKLASSRMTEQTRLKRETIHSYANNSPIFTSSAFEHGPSSPLPTYQPFKRSPQVPTAAPRDSNKQGRRSSRLRNSSLDWQRFIPPLGPAVTANKQADGQTDNRQSEFRSSVANYRAAGTPLQESNAVERSCPLQEVSHSNVPSKTKPKIPYPPKANIAGNKTLRPTGTGMYSADMYKPLGSSFSMANQQQHQQQQQKQRKQPQQQKQRNQQQRKQKLQKRTERDGKILPPASVPSPHAIPSERMNMSSTSVLKVSESAGSTEKSFTATEVGTSPSKVLASGTDDSSGSEKRSRSHSKRDPKYCYACGKQIVGTLVKAMGRKYHVDCFKCFDCGKLCSDKFFAEDVEVPVDESLLTEPGEENSQGKTKKIQVPLCEYDYFRRINLICYNCNKAIRGSYITAIGRKYHPEHFYCEVCHKVFETEDYYEHDGKIYCHYHYSRLYASHCEACKSAILKQYVEMHRGGREQQWHPECFMIHKFWGVDVTIDCTGFDRKVDDIVNMDDNTITPAVLFDMESGLEKMTMSIWITLSEFEEACATCISDMLHAATVSNKTQGLLASGKLVSKIECLFRGIDSLNSYAKNNGLTIDYKSERYRKMSPLTREPRNLSSKLMSYLTFLRDSNQKSVALSKYSRELLSLISMLAHYIKLISRNTLMHSLEYNRMTKSTVATDRYLAEIASHRKVPDNIFAALSIPYKAKGTCKACEKSIEGRCYRFENFRWHPKCLKCSKCGLQFDSEGDNLLVSEISYDKKKQAVLCEKCGSDNMNATYGFVEVSAYEQLIYLLKIALVRSEHAMVKRGLIAERVECQGLQQNDRYSQQVSDITRMRSMRQNRKVGTATNEMRKSVIVEAPEASTAGTEDLHSRDQGQSDDTEQDDARVERFEPLEEVEQENISGASEHEGNEEEENADDNIQLDGSVQNESTRTSSLNKDQRTASGSLRSSRTDFSSRSNRKSSRFLHKNRSLGRRGSKRLRIEDVPMESTPSNVNLDATSNLLKNEKGLTLDDIPRIVSSEQAREYRPNAFRFQKRNYETATSTLPVPKPVQKRLGKSGHAKSNGKAGRKSTDARFGTSDNAASTVGAGKTIDDEFDDVGTDIEKRKELEEAILGTVPDTEDANTPKHSSSEHLNQTPKRFSELTTEQHEQLRHVAAFALHILLSDQLSLEDCVSFIDVQRTPSFWGKIFGGNKKAPYSNVHKIFGEPLEAISAKFGVDSDLGVGPEKVRIPMLVDEIINAMKTKDLSAEGVFRLNGNIRRLKKLMGEIDTHPNSVPDLYSENQIQLAALLKKFARGLPDPLLTFKLYDLFILSQKYAEEPEKRDRILKLAYAMLPKVHRDLTEVLLAFLNWVATFCHIDEETGSKMDIHNLATVLTPNVLYSRPKNIGKTPDSAELIPNGENHFLAIEVVNTMIEKHDDLSIIPPDLLTLYRGAGLADPLKRNKLSTREIMTMCKQAYEKNPELLQRWVE